MRAAPIRRAYPQRRRSRIVLAALLWLTASLGLGRQAQADMLLIPSGIYPPYSPAGQAEERVASFRLDDLPVTNGAYRAFVARHPRWRRSNVKPVFADQTYLAHWAGDLDPGPLAPRDAPVVNVSWFAAAAYCRARGARLPTTAEWEYALFDRGRDAEAVRERLAAWHSEPNPAVWPAAAQAKRNGFGVRGLAGLVWEWTRDFQSIILRGKQDDPAFCGQGAATDTQDYFRYLRYAYRAGLRAQDAIGNLGFRCATDAD